MNRGEYSDSIPNDLVLEILSRLPAKSTGRFRCVSKLWGSMLHKLYFTELFLTRSSARPRLLIGIHIYGEWCFFSSPHPQNPYEKSSIVVRPDFHMKFGRDTRRSCRYASGLLYFARMQISSKDNTNRVICNPIKKQFAILPQPRLTDRTYHEMLGFDLIGKQFKVLSMDKIFYNDEAVHYILTLGTEELRWRKIQCPLSHSVRSVGISISGVLYYLAIDIVGRIHVISCFDVRSEKFTFLNLNPYCPYQLGSTTLINYKGKLGVVNLNSDNDGGFPIQLRMCVLEDFEKQEWSTYVYTLMPENEVVKTKYKVSVVGMTSTGEIVLVKRNACKPFYAFYFNPERNTLLRVEIQGVGEDRVEIQGVGEDRKWYRYHRVCAFVDHVEDLQFNTPLIMNKQKRKTTSTSTSSRKDHQGRTVAHPQ